MAVANTASRASTVRSQFFTNPKPTNSPDNDANHVAVFTGLQALSQQVSQDTAAPFLFAVAANPGDAINISAGVGTSQAHPADALTPAYAHGFLLSNIPVAPLSVALVQFYGLNQFLTGLAPGSRYYLSDTPGQYSLAPGTNQQAVGIALTENTMMFFPQVIS